MKKTILLSVICLLVGSCTNKNYNNSAFEEQSSSNFFSSNEFISSIMEQSSSSEADDAIFFDELIDYNDINHIVLIDDISKKESIELPTIIEKERISNYYNNVLKNLSFTDNDESLNELLNNLGKNYASLDIFTEDNSSYKITIDRNNNQFYIEDNATGYKYAGIGIIINYDIFGMTFDEIIESNDIDIDDITSINWKKSNNDSLQNFITFTAESHTDISSIWFSIPQLVNYRFTNIRYNQDYDGKYISYIRGDTNSKNKFDMYQFVLTNHTYFYMHENDKMLILRISDNVYYYLKDESFNSKEMPNCNSFSSKELLEILLANKNLAMMGLFSTCELGIGYYISSTFALDALLRRDDSGTLLLNEFLYNNTYSKEDKEFIEFILFLGENMGPEFNIRYFYYKLTPEERELIKEYDHSNNHYPSYVPCIIG